MEILKISTKSRKHLPKRIIITHSDADGLTSAMVIQSAIEKLENKEFYWLVLSSSNPTSAETEKMIDFAHNLVPLQFGDKIFICDRANPTPEYLNINQALLEKTHIIFIDHHITNDPNLWLKRTKLKNISYAWSDSESGATLSLKYFKDTFAFDEKFPELYANLDKFTEIVKLWDIFTWTKLDKDDDSEKYLGALGVNAMEKVLGKKYFYKKIIENMNDLSKLKELLEMSYEIYMDDYKDYCKISRKKALNYRFGKYFVKIFYDFDQKYQSLFSHEIFEEDEADIVAFVTTQGTISLRSKKDVDVSTLSKKLGMASKFSGGGHKNASGYRSINQDEIKEFIMSKFLDNMNAVAKSDKVVFESFIY